MKRLPTIADMYVILMTPHLKEQLLFYQNVLGLEQIFFEEEAVGLGKQGRLLLILRAHDVNEQDHPSTAYKGPQLLTFSFDGAMENYEDKIKAYQVVVRDTLT